MTEATTPPTQPGPAEFLQIWSDSLSQVLGQITGAPVACKLQTEAPADFPAAAESDQWALVTSSGGLRGEMSIRSSAATALRLAKIFMGEPADPEAELTADHRDAVIELLRQVGGIVSSGAKARWGEVQLRAEAGAAAPSWPSAATYWLHAGDDGPTGMALEFVLSAALAAELKAEKSESARTEAVSSDAAKAGPPGTATSPSADAGAIPNTLDRLMDVQLSMTMRFGSKRLLLREVLDLGPGSVVELDREIQEPVELLLDGKMVARGEVVVIEGNYGLRVTDISNPEPR
jgi:flagellar motor switch protein FliN